MSETGPHDRMEQELADWGKAIVLETRGRHSGLPRRVTIGFAESGDELLVAVGRAPNTDGLGLEEAGVRDNMAFESVTITPNGRSLWTATENALAAVVDTDANSDGLVDLGSIAAPATAKNIVAAGLARRVEVQLAYAIGVAESVSVMVDAFGTEVVAPDRITSAVRDVFDLTPRGIISYLDLLRPIYKKTAAFGHFGRNDPDFTWEATNRTEDLRTACGL